MGIVLPEWVRADMEAEAFIERTRYQATTLGRLLKDLDPHLDLIWVKSGAPAGEGMVPGRWHVRNQRPGTPTVYMPITQKDGGYMEPHAGIVEQLKAMDLHKAGDISQHLRDKRYREEKMKEKEKALKREQRLDHAAQDYRAAKRVAGDTLYKRRWAAN